MSVRRYGRGYRKARSDDERERDVNDGDNDCDSVSSGVHVYHTSGRSSKSDTTRRSHFFDRDSCRFSELKWRQLATRSLLQATKAVDQVCHAVVSTKPSIARSSKSSREIRKLALTVAVFERSLYAYALGIKRDRQKAEEEAEADKGIASPYAFNRRDSCPLPSRRDSSDGESSAEGRVYSRPSHRGGMEGRCSSPHSPSSSSPLPPNLPSTTPADLPIFSPSRAYMIPDRLKTSFMPDMNLNRPKQIKQRHLKLSGGMVSLLRLLTRTLNETTESLNSLAHDNSFFHFTQHTKLWLLFPLVFTLRKQINGFCKGWLDHVLDRFFSMKSLPKSVGRFNFIAQNAVLACFLYTLYKRSLNNRIAVLRRLHERLGILLRLWHISIYVIEAKERDTEVGEHGQVAISQWMLELVPPSLDCSFWYKTNWQLNLLKKGMDVMYSSLGVWYNVVGDRLWGMGCLAWATLYYTMRHQKAAAQCSAMMSSPDLRFLAMAWRTHDAYLLPRAIWLYSRYISPLLQLSPKLAVMREIELTDDYPNTEAEMLSPLRQSRHRTIKMLLISASPLDISINTKLRSTRSSITPRNLKAPSSPIIIYIHGGGMIADFRSCHLTYLKRWAVETGAPILYVDYSLAPENAYPTALDECYDVFKWVAEGRLGIRPSSIILAGDSIGGNLAVGVCLRSIANDDRRQPDGLMLAYPILNLQLTPTPSRTVFMMDAIVPMNVLLQCRSVYLPPQCDANTDPCLSPVMASDELLKALPPTSIMVGGFDPFVDDAVDFAHRLHANHVPCRLKVYRHLPHCFLNFAPILPDAHRAVLLACRWLTTSFEYQPTDHSEEE